MIQLLRRLLVEEDGPTAVEYAVMLALIIAACLVSIGLLGTQTSASFNSSAGQLNGVLGS